MATHNKPVAELRIGAVKATVWENEVGGITRHNVTFSRLYRDEEPVEHHAQLRLQEPADSRQARRSGAHAHCRAQRRGGAVGQRWRSGVKRPHLPAAGSSPPPFLSGRTCRREDGTSVKNKRSPRRMFRQVIPNI